jgi:tetratricopeptide (TPR) repeat protein
MLLSSLVNNLFRRRRAGGNQSHLQVLQQVYRLQQEKDLLRACDLCEGILRQDPLHARAHLELGRMHGQGGNLDKAFHHLRKAVELEPGSGSARVALGNVYGLQGDKKAAEACYRSALELDPDLPEAHYNLALFLKRPGKFEEALAHLERAAALAPDFTDAMKERVLCLIHLERYDEAESLLGREMARRPDSGALHACSGLMRQRMHRPAEALNFYEEAQRLGYADADLHLNRGIAFQDLGRINEALDSYDQAIRSQNDPKLKGAPRFHRALARLLTGDFGAWPDYEIRLQSEDLPRRARVFPRWDGGDLAGRTLLIYGEQGLGDEIMFASCLPEVISRARHCVIECAPKLESMFRRSFPAATVYAAAAGCQPQVGAASPDIDCEVPIGSLPLYFRRRAADFPRHGGYLQADRARVEYWKQQLASLGAGIKVGISWRGGSLQTRSPLRSIPLEQWSPILRTDGVQFVSLQYDASGDELDKFWTDRDIGIKHWPDAIADYDETAALVSALDLTISVCTAAIHLGGALGRPVWVMAPYSPEWRYGFAGETMPWYPSVRIFRQSAFGQWTPVVGKVAQHLRELSDLGH